MPAAETLRRLRLFPARMTPMLVCLIAAAYLLIGDRTPWGECLTIWPPVGWGVLFVVRALVLWLEAHRRLAIVTALLAGLFVVATTELSSLFRRTDPGKAARFGELRASEARQNSRVPLRVVSWNVAGRAPVSQLEELDPDLCLLQEIGDISSAMKASPYWRGFQWFPALDPGTLTRHSAVVLETARIGPWTEPQLILLDLDGRSRPEDWEDAGAAARTRASSAVDAGRVAARSAVPCKRPAHSALTG